mmetsp:Transcript_26881/g.77852  ORF Transcript_26881/g.77852 Transcript_26881/m.77852 type:complete len:368 (-) Transcript_26881:501-1604(-)
MPWTSRENLTSGNLSGCAHTTQTVLQCRTDLNVFSLPARHVAGDHLWADHSICLITADLGTPSLVMVWLLSMSKNLTVMVSPASSTTVAMTCSPSSSMPAAPPSSTTSVPACKNCWTSLEAAPSSSRWSSNNWSPPPDSCEKPPKYLFKYGLTALTVGVRAMFCSSMQWAGIGWPRRKWRHSSVKWTQLCVNKSYFSKPVYRSAHLVWTKSMNSSCVANVYPSRTTGTSGMTSEGSTLSTRDSFMGGPKHCVHGGGVRKIFPPYQYSEPKTSRAVWKASTSDRPRRRGPAHDVAPLEMSYKISSTGVLFRPSVQPMASHMSTLPSPFTSATVSSSSFNFFASKMSELLPCASVANSCRYCSKSASVM